MWEKEYIYKDENHSSFEMPEGHAKMGYVFHCYWIACIVLVTVAIIKAKLQKLDAYQHYNLLSTYSNAAYSKPQFSLSCFANVSCCIHKLVLLEV